MCPLLFTAESLRQLKVKEPRVAAWLLEWGSVQGADHGPECLKVTIRGCRMRASMGLSCLSIRREPHIERFFHVAQDGTHDEPRAVVVKVQFTGDRLGEVVAAAAVEGPPDKNQLILAERVDAAPCLIGQHHFQAAMLGQVESQGLAEPDQGEPHAVIARRRYRFRPDAQGLRIVRKKTHGYHPERTARGPFMATRRSRCRRGLH